MQRYFIKEEQIKNKTVIITGGDYHHIKNVIRMNPGDRIIVCPNNGKAYLTAITAFDNKTVRVRIISELPANPEMAVAVTVAVGYTRSTKQEEVARRLAELGTARFLPVFMKRSVARAGANQERKTERLIKIVKEACEQSERTRLMEVAAPLSFSELVAAGGDHALAIYAYEEKRNDKSLKNLINGFTGKSIIVLIGPEGGFAPEEVSFLNQAGWQAVGLGPRILRVETAPLYLMSAIAYALELSL